MSEELDFDALRAAARRVRRERLRDGLPRPGKARRRPRSPEKIALLQRMVRDRLAKYPPYYDGEVLVLPYYLGEE